MSEVKKRLTLEEQLKAEQAAGAAALAKATARFTEEQKAGAATVHTAQAAVSRSATPDDMPHEHRRAAPKAKAE